MRLTAPGAAIRLAGLLALAAALPTGAAEPAFAETYVCDAGAVVRVAYVNPPEGPSYAIVDWAGELVPMRTAPAGSGAAYADVDPRRGLLWRTKGDEGFLTVRASSAASGTDHDPDREPEEITLVSGCRAAGR